MTVVRSLATVIIATAIAVATTAGAHAWVLPAIGGDQVKGAPWMKHAEIDFDGTKIAVHVDDTVATPLLRPLSPPNEFDPSEPWAPLIGTAHNFQYGWVLGSAWAPPHGLGVFVEQLAASPGLETYEGGRFMNETVIRRMTFDPLFPGGEAWQWSGVMTHNAYAVRRPTESVYSATYRVFLADAATGVEPTDAGGNPVYGSDRAVFTWAATPVPEPAGATTGAWAFAALIRGRRSKEGRR